MSACARQIRLRSTPFTPPHLPAAAQMEILVAKRVEDILPMLQDAARGVAEAEKGLAVPVERM